MPKQAIVKIIKEELSEMTKSLADKILLGSMAVSSSIATAQAGEVIPETTTDIATWLPTDYALALSMISMAILILERTQTMIYKAVDRHKQKQGK